MMNRCPPVCFCYGAAIPLALLTLLGATSSTRPTTAPSATRLFVSSEHLFQLRYPADWVRPQQPVHGQLFSIRTPVFADGKFGELGLRIDSAPADTPDSVTLFNLSGSIVGVISHGGGKGLRITKGELAGFPSRIVSFHTDATRVMYIMMVRKHVEYVFNVAAPTGQFDAILPKVNRLLESFALIE